MPTPPMPRVVSASAAGLAAVLLIGATARAADLDDQLKLFHSGKYQVSPPASRLR